MELNVITPPVKKKYDHVYEATDLSRDELSLLRDKIQAVFHGRPCKRILLVQCPQIKQEVFHWENARLRRYPCFPPYGPALMIRILEDNGYITDIIDLDYAVISHAHQVDEADFSFDIWKQRLATKINDFKPDMVGVSCMFNAAHGNLKEVILFLKKDFPEIPRCAGGVHISLTTELLLNDIPELDFAMLYEADQSFINFLDVINGKKTIDDLAQIATVSNNRLIKLTKRLLPEKLVYSPNYKDLPIEKYGAVGKIGAYTFLRPDGTPSATVLSARGCRARCSFCSVRSVNGPGVRIRDYTEVVDEIERLKKTYGIRHIMWLDDDLFYNGDRAIEMFEELASRKLDITWDASNGIIAAALNERLVKACVASGCIGFNIGIESGNPQMLLEMKKPGTVQSFRRASKLLLDYAPNIFAKGFLVIGFPDETLAMLKDSINLCLEIQLDWYPIQILTPMPGTPVFQLMQDQGLLGDIPTTTLGKARTFTVGAMGSLGKREKLEKQQARNFVNIFSGDLSRVPERDEMEDIYMAMDYEINYKIILGYTNTNKLFKKRAMIQEICHRMTSENALGTLYLGIIEQKLGNEQKAAELFTLAKHYRDISAFWQVRFDALGLNELLNG